ncbi:MAG TPA: methyltransferase domain-containing protein [Chloroflexia bacterium]|nr:methyltransferase domain-containing protein [Chloroflexia bacterium]
MSHGLSPDSVGGSTQPSVSGESYLLADQRNEEERLRLQARVWEPEVEAWLDRVGLTPGATCLDLGCGAMGILGPLSRRVGPTGHVLGVDNDSRLLSAAAAYVQVEGLSNVELRSANAYQTGLPRAAFDFVHARFMFAPLGHDADLLQEMLALTRAGGTVAIQEPDATSWTCYPPHSAWAHLKASILTAFRQGGGDFNAGQRTFQMLRDAGLVDVQVRAAVLALHDAHPYMRLPIQFATSLRPRLLEGGILTERELDELLAACEAIAADPGTSVLSFIVTQVWGRKPA